MGISTPAGLACLPKLPRWPGLWPTSRPREMGDQKRYVVPRIGNARFARTRQLCASFGRRRRLYVRPKAGIQKTTGSFWSRSSRCRLHGRPQQHSEEVAWLVGIGKQVELFIEAGRLQLVAHIAQGRKILDGEAD